MDPTDHSGWCATDPGKKNRSAIIHFDAQGKLLERYTPTTAGRHALNDFVLGGKSEIYVTDTEGNHVFRFDRESHQFVELNLGRPVIESDLAAEAPSKLVVMHRISVGNRDFRLFQSMYRYQVDSDGRSGFRT